MRPVLITPPAEQPVSLAEFKAHARIDHSDDDLIAQSYIAAAVMHLDGLSGVLGRAIVTQTWRQEFSEWLDMLRLPFPDVASVTVTYFDTAGDEQTVSGDLYEVIEDATGACVAFRDAFTSPALNDDMAYPVRVDMVTGYGAASDVPANIKLAIMALAAHWYEQRAAASEKQMAAVPIGVDALIAPLRRVGV